MQPDTQTTAGNYTDLCDELYDRVYAEGTVIMVYNGLSGSGFSARGTPAFCMALPQTLRHMADQLESDNLARQHRLS